MYSTQIVSKESLVQIMSKTFDETGTEGMQ